MYWLFSICLSTPPPKSCPALCPGWLTTPLPEPLLTSFWLGLANGKMAGGREGGEVSSPTTPLLGVVLQAAAPPSVNYSSCCPALIGLPELYAFLPPLPREVQLPAFTSPWVPQHPLCFPSTLWVVPSLQSLHLSHLRGYSRCL